ncbi:MAG: class I SAM-dependent methyltransferase [candidate division Zixibacteria bacterium]|nr:class I SAM-dependent methyltransferase [candidate division Zixibacteria bacterium]
MEMTLSTSEYVNCNICGIDEAELVFVAKENQFNLDGHFKIVKCKKCGLVYVNPRPTKENIGFYYPEGKYYTHCEPSKNKPLRHKIKRLVIRSIPGYDTKTGRFKKLLGTILEKFLSGQICNIVPFKENGKILDVGCGNGEMIGWMEEYGWKTYGVEISKEACEQAEKQGIQVFYGELQNAHFPSEFFDVITANQVLEHVYDPLALLKECNRILKEDGLLIIGCPNFGCFDSRLFSKDWSALQVPTHLYHFTPSTLNRILKTAGFEINKWKFKIPFPFCDQPSIKIYKENNKNIYLIHLLKLILKAFLFKGIKWIFSTNRGSKFSVNLNVYASKTSGGEY